MRIYNSYHNHNDETASTTVKNIVGRGIVFIIMAIIAFFISIHLFSEKSQLIMKADIEVEKAKFENAVKSYKARTGVFPEIAGNENNLRNIKSPDGKYSFDIFYGDEKIFTVPGDMEREIEDSNTVVPVKDNKGGWFYNKMNGEVQANLE